MKKIILTVAYIASVALVSYLAGEGYKHTFDRI